MPLLSINIPVIQYFILARGGYKLAP